MCRGRSKAFQQVTAKRNISKQSFITMSQGIFEGENTPRWEILTGTAYAAIINLGLLSRMQVIRLGEYEICAGRAI
jgi:hypothetical protein